MAVAEMQIDRHDLMRVEQRVAPAADVDAALGIEFRRAAVIAARQRRSCEYEVERREQGNIRFDHLDGLRRLFTEVFQNMLDFLRFLTGQLAQIVVQLDDGHRLDKERGTGGGLVVDHARHLRTVFRLDRDAVASAAHRDDVVLEFRRQGGGADHGRQLPVNPLVRIADLPAHVLQRRRGVIGNGLFVRQAAPDLAPQRRQRFEQGKIFGQRVVGILLGNILAAVGFYLRGDVECRCDVQQFRDTECAADLQPHDRAADVPDAGEGKAAVFIDSCERVGRLRLALPYLAEIGGRAEIPAEFLACRRSGFAGKHINDLIVFKYAKCFFVHSIPPPFIL